jgi:UDPglucose 6-dehydrogenase
MENAEREQPQLGYCKSLEDAARNADLVCVLTEWAEFRNADPGMLGDLVAERRVIDGRNCLDAALWAAAGWQHRGMGKPATSEP